MESIESSNIIQKNEAYLRLKTVLYYSGHTIYGQLLVGEKDIGFSPQPEIIYKELLPYKPQLEKLLKKNEINEEEFISLFPSSEKTYLRECNLKVLHKVLEVCLKNNPIGKTNTTMKFNVGSSKRPQPMISFTPIHPKYMSQLEKLQDVINNKTLRKTISKCSKEQIDDKWNDIFDILTKLGYDVKKILNMKTIPILDTCSPCHEAYLRCQIELLLEDCERYLRFSNINKVALERLNVNLVDAMNSSNDYLKADKDLCNVRAIDDLLGDIEILSSLLSSNRNILFALIPDLKNWKYKNIEGDIIVMDEQIYKLSNQVNHQSQLVSEYFCAVSDDIVKVKVRATMNFEKNENEMFNVGKKSRFRFLTNLKFIENIDFLSIFAKRDLYDME